MAAVAAVGEMLEAVRLHQVPEQGALGWAPGKLLHSGIVHLVLGGDGCRGSSFEIAVRDSVVAALVPC